MGRCLYQKPHPIHEADTLIGAAESRDGGRNHSESGIGETLTQVEGRFVGLAVRVVGNIAGSRLGRWSEGIT